MEWLRLTPAGVAGGMWLLHLALLLGRLAAVALESPAALGNASGLPCSPHAAQCWTPEQVRALPPERFCDGRWDCPDGADEAEETCQHPGAPPAPACPCLFQCGEGEPCFPAAWVCDAHADCEDGQDEQGCSPDSPGTSLGPSTAGTGVGCGETECLTARTGRERPATGNPAIPKSEKPVLSDTRGPLWVTAVFVLLSVLVAAGCTVTWGQSRAKNKCSSFSLEKTSKEQLVPDRRLLDSSP
ncbi:SCO-spondin-like [Emydura macquarii macquarii]|uniref:SCO-spondin-like n=1 Tax=Emydura macquarii macquarii TaxID=1129001 RepID=UPI00352BADB0